MYRPISFHPLSVIFETPSHPALYEKVGVKQLVSDVFDELLALAKAQGCIFPADFKEKTLNEMLRPADTNSIMYQDFMAKRPMEVETYLGSPIKLAQASGLKMSRIETLYAILHNLNTVNQQRRDAGPGAGGMPPPRLSSMPPPPRSMANGGGPRGRGGRTSSMTGPPPPGMRRGPPPMNGGPPNGYGRPMTSNGYTSRNQSRRGSMEGNDLEEFSHLVLYGDIPESGESAYGGDNTDMGLRERELMLRQREMAVRDQEMRMRRGGGNVGGRRKGPGSVRNGGFDDDDDDDDFFDPMDAPPGPPIDPDNFDMMSVTSVETADNRAPASYAITLKVVMLATARE